MFQNHILPKKYAAWDKSETTSDGQASQFQMSTDGSSLWGARRALEKFLRGF